MRCKRCTHGPDCGNPNLQDVEERWWALPDAWRAVALREKWDDIRWGGCGVFAPTDVDGVSHAGPANDAHNCGDEVNSLIKLWDISEDASLAFSRHEIADFALAFEVSPSELTACIEACAWAIIVTFHQQPGHKENDAALAGRTAMIGLGTKLREVMGIVRQALMSNPGDDDLAELQRSASVVIKRAALLEAARDHAPKEDATRHGPGSGRYVPERWADAIAAAMRETLPNVKYSGSDGGGPGVDFLIKVLERLMGRTIKNGKAVKALRASGAQR